MIKESAGLMTLIPENIPEQLTERPQWVVWRHEEGEGGECSKVPYNAETHARASHSDLITWRPFEVALEAYRASEGRYSGLGFVLSSGDPYVGLDLDECRDPKTGEIALWAQKVMDRVHQGHIEISPSGAGVHVIIEGMMRGQKTQRKVPGGGKIELYYQQRFLSVTGNVL